MDEKEITAHEAQPQAVEETLLVWRDARRQLSNQFGLFGWIGIEGRPQP